MIRVAGGVLAAVALASCSARLVPPGVGNRPSPIELPVRQPVAALPIAPKATVVVAGSNARSVGVIAGPDISTLPISDVGARRALGAFRTSCPALLRRTDLSGLTQAADWASACAAATTWSLDQARQFFATNFKSVQVGGGTAYATGYYEPEIAASRTRSADYATPIYARPPDLVDIDLGQFNDALKGKRIAGRIAGNAFVPYADRSAIEDGALTGQRLELAWAADPVELFFLQVQGSGRLRLPDGSIMRIAYAGQNGRDYTGIGKLMKERGLVGPGQLSMQGIMAWLRANPEQGRTLMRENKSWVFFRELTGPGPVGALNIPVTASTSVAADPMFVPLGAPVFLSMDRADVTGLWVAQDTGGAIKGANRVDTFWGAGADARAIAGGMSARGTAFLLLPKGTLARLAANGGTTP